MISFYIKEDQTIWLALILSLLIHALVFVCSGRSFIPQAKFSVQPDAQRVEVSLEEIEYSPSVEEQGHGSVKIKQKTIKAKQVAHSNSGVEVKANPDYFKNPAPVYPQLAKQMHQEGLVLLSIDVDKQGMPIEVTITQSSGFRLLDQAALRAVSHWRFQPGRIGNFSMESEVVVPVRFRLEK